MLRRLATVGLLLPLAFVAAAGNRQVDLPFKDLAGNKVRLRDHRGKVVVLNFWATWCGPCKEELPMFVELHKEYASRGVVFIAASLDERDTRAKIPEYIQNTGITFPVWTGASTLDLDDLKLGAGIPATAFLDTEGRIAMRVLGAITKDQLKERIDWLLSDRKSPSPDPFLQNNSPR